MTNNAVNIPLPASISNGGTGITTTPTNGSLLIANNNQYSAATLTAGGNCLVTNTAGAVQLNLRNNATQSLTANDTAELVFLFATNVTQITWQNITPSVDGESFIAETSNNSGVSWQTTGYSSGLHLVQYDGTGWVHDNIASRMVLSRALNAGNAKQFSCGCVIYSGRGSTRSGMSGTTTVFDKTANEWMLGQYSVLSPSTGINAIRFRMTSGNIATGTIVLTQLRL